MITKQSNNQHQYIIKSSESNDPTNSNTILHHYQFYNSKIILLHCNYFYYTQSIIQKLSNNIINCQINLQWSSSRIIIRKQWEAIYQISNSITTSLSNLKFNGELPKLKFQFFFTLFPQHKSVISNRESSNFFSLNMNQWLATETAPIFFSST